jgi:tRNA-Thr(GGU) m(6)t(6)A37 methyltransferase TsaA
MKRNRKGEMVASSGAASSSSLSPPIAMLPNTSTPRPLIPPAVISGLEELLSSAVAGAQADSALPPHTWSPFTISVMSSTRSATHYTATVIKNVHAYNAALGVKEEGKGKGRKKKKMKNEKGESVTVAAEEEPAVESNANPAAAASSSNVVPANAYDWCVIISRYASSLLSSPSPSVSSFLSLISSVVLDVPKPEASVRGGGFIDFRIEPKEGEREPVPFVEPSSSSSSSSSFHFSSIGVIDSVFKLKYGTPRQGTIAPHSRGSLTLNANIPVESLEGLEEYSHIWLVFIFHRNENKKFRPKIEPPRAGGLKLGVFATRTPHRVNPVGLSLVKLDSISGRTLHLSSLDLIQGTPIIDIKPYHPADVCMQASVPKWMKEQQEVKPPFIVRFTPEAESDLLSVSSKLEFFHSASEVRAAIEESVGLDPRPIYVRERAKEEEVYGYRLDRLNILYRVADEKKEAEVCAVQYVDYEALRKEKEEEKRTAGGSMKPHSAPLTSAEEEALTKKFLAQRPVRSYPKGTAAAAESSNSAAPAENSSASAKQK